MKNEIIIIGGGAAGMMAAYSAALAGGTAVVFEKNEKLGKKLYITGKGRCNFTNAVDIKDFMENIPRNPRFLYSAFSSFSNTDMIDLLSENGVKTKIERGKRAFPYSDKSSDVIKALSRLLQKNGVSVRLNENVRDIILEDGSVKGIIKENGERISSPAVIIATGGLSYPATGSTGDGFEFSRKAGHNITALSPSLVPFNCKEGYIFKMQGLSLKNVRLSLYSKENKKPVFSETGEMSFTHFGVSGPLVLSASSLVSDALFGERLLGRIDLKIALSENDLKERMIRETKKSPKRSMRTLLEDLLPRSMVPVFSEMLDFTKERVLSELKKEERDELIRLLKAFPFTVEGKRGYNEAVITKGGVAVNEIENKTMGSKKVKGLYFAGEVIDCDALTGGFNLQIAWSTGFLAGRSAALFCQENSKD